MNDSSLHLLCFYLLLSTLMPCLQATTTTQQLDSLATATIANTHELIRVQKKSEVDYIFSIAGNSWKQFPQLRIEFDLEFSQFIQVKYLIALHTNSNLVTRVMIDGQEYKDFRMLTGNTAWNTNEGYDVVWLEKGIHIIKVQYRTPASVTNHPSTIADCTAAMVKVRYYKQGKMLPRPMQKTFTKQVYADDDYQFYGNNKWHQMSNMLILLELTQEKEVEISYRIIAKTDVQCPLSIRIKVDNQVNRDFNAMSGDTSFHQLAVNGGKVKLSKGAHILQLEYKTSGVRSVAVDRDQQVAFMAVTYQQ